MSKKGQTRGNGQDRRAKVPRCQHTVVAAVCAAADWPGSWRTGYPDLSSQHLDRNTADVRVERRRWARLLSARGSHAARVPDGVRVYCLGFAAGGRLDADLGRGQVGSWLGSSSTKHRIRLAAASAGQCMLVHPVAASGKAPPRLASCTWSLPDDYARAFRSAPASERPNSARYW
jgi:hypothetical protein